MPGTVTTVFNRERSIAIETTGVLNYRIGEGHFEILFKHVGFLTDKISSKLRGLCYQKFQNRKRERSIVLKDRSIARSLWESRSEYRRKLAAEWSSGTKCIAGRRISRVDALGVRRFRLCVSGGCYEALRILSCERRVSVIDGGATARHREKERERRRATR